MANAGLFTTRPVYLGCRGVVASGHYLAALAGQRMFERGGNAIDAAVASGFALNVLEPHQNGLGGEVPILVYTPRLGKVVAVSGQGWAGRAMTIDWFRAAGIDLIPGDGFLPATVPAALGTWACVLMHFGTLTLRDVLEPAIDCVESGFPVYPALRNTLAGLAWRFRAEWPSSAEVYLPNNRVPEVGERLCNPDLAATLKRVVEVEAREQRRGREGAIQAAIDFWYKGDIADRILEYLRQTAVRDASGRAHHGLLSKDDFAQWQPELEEPVSATYHGLEVYKCGPWTQGPVFLQQLLLLEGFDLRQLRHNSPDYIHTVTEAAKLAFADRERYYGDPKFGQVPLDRLLSREYAALRRRLIDPEQASQEQRPGAAAPHTPQAHRGDTTHTCAADIHGNLMAATCSGGWIPSSPVIPGLGFAMGTRAQMFSLDPEHPNALMPRKRPRTTLTPSLALRAGRPWMVFGTPGGDQQDQWTLQFFLNHVEFGMNLQEAIDRPTFHSVHFPSSFYPREAVPGGVVLEGRIPDTTRRELERRGHKVSRSGSWAHGKVMAVQLDREKSVLAGAVSPRTQIGYVLGR